MTPSTDDLAAASSAVTTALADVELPTGADATLGGVVTQQQDAFSQLGLALLAAILIVYIVMVATFKSLRQPLLLLVSVPFAATGAILLQIITGVPLGVASLIGVLMLIGIVVTNAIVLVDLVNQYREKGLSAYEATVAGGSRRLRPDPHDGARDDLRAHADGARHHGPRRVHLAAARDRRDRRSHLLDGADAARAADPLQPRGRCARAPRGPEVREMRMPQTRRRRTTRARRRRMPAAAEPALAGVGTDPRRTGEADATHATRRTRLTARRRSDRRLARSCDPRERAVRVRDPRCAPSSTRSCSRGAATARRSVEPNVASHTKISAKPTISSAARVMPPATKTTIAGTSSAATPTEIMRSRRTVHGLAITSDEDAEERQHHPRCGALVEGGVHVERHEADDREVSAEGRDERDEQPARRAGGRGRPCRAGRGCRRKRVARGGRTGRTIVPADSDPRLKTVPEKSR